MPGSKEEKKLRIKVVLHFLSHNYLPFGCGVMKFFVPCLFTLPMLHTKFGLRLTLLFMRGRCNRMTHDGLRTPTHSNRSPEWFRWPKNMSFEMTTEIYSSHCVDIFLLANQNFTHRKSWFSSLASRSSWTDQIINIHIKCARFTWKLHNFLCNTQREDIIFIL